MSKLAKDSTGHIILICGGSSTGKSSASNHLRDIKRPPKLYHLDFDEQIFKLAKGEDNESMKEAFNYVIERLPEAANKASFFMDHWMPPSYELKARSLLTDYKTFYVWLMCSSFDELKRREKERYIKGEGRGSGITEVGYELKPNIPYDYYLDTNGKKPSRVAELIFKKSRKHWGYKS